MARFFASKLKMADIKADQMCVVVEATGDLLSPLATTETMFSRLYRVSVLHVHTFVMDTRTPTCIRVYVYMYMYTCICACDNW